MVDDRAGELDVEGKHRAVAPLDGEADLAFAAIGPQVMDAGRDGEARGLVHGRPGTRAAWYTGGRYTGGRAKSRSGPPAIAAGSSPLLTNRSCLAGRWRQFAGARLTVIVMASAAAALCRVVSVALVPPASRRATAAWLVDMRAASSR